MNTIEKLQARRLAGLWRRRTNRHQHAKGRLTAREWLSVLLDPESFKELDILVEHNGRMT